MGRMVFPTGFCSITGLTVERRPHWEGIRLADGYTISFWVVGQSG